MKITEVTIRLDPTSNESSAMSSRILSRDKRKRWTAYQASEDNGDMALFPSEIKLINKILILIAEHNNSQGDKQNKED